MMAVRTAEAPVLTTDRLVLRGHVPSDLDACAVMWADPDVTRYIGGKPSTREEVWQRILRYAGLWSLLGFGYWALLDRVSGAFVGELGFADFQRQLDIPLHGAPELGWALVPEAHGRGLATEAVRAAVAWGDEHLARRTVCLIAPENRQSVRVATKCGFQELAQTAYRGSPTLLFHRDGTGGSAKPPVPP